MRRLGVAPRSRSPFPDVGEGIRVLSRGGVPLYLEWRECLWPILSVEASWCIESRWWLDGERSGTKRRYLRVCVQSPRGGTLSLEVFRTQNPQVGTGQWRLWRVAD